VCSDRKDFLFFLWEIGNAWRVFFYGGVKEEEILEKLFLFQESFALLVVF